LSAASPKHRSFRVHARCVPFSASPGLPAAEGIREKFGLDCALKEAISDLICDDPVFSKRGLCWFEFFDAEVAHTNKSNFAAIDQFLHCGHRLFDWHDRIMPMDLEIDAINAQPP